MPSQTVRRLIDSPVTKVFDTVAHIDNFAKAVPHIVRTDVVSEVKSGVGTRFRETRLMNGREVTQELEVTEYEPNQRVRIVCDAGGTVWDSLFTTSAADGGTALELNMQARPHKLLAKLTVPLMMLMIRKAVESDIDAVKAYCEQTNE